MASKAATLSAARGSAGARAQHRAKSIHQRRSSVARDAAAYKQHNAAHKNRIARIEEKTKREEKKKEGRNYNKHHLSRSAPALNNSNGSKRENNNKSINEKALFALSEGFPHQW